MMSNESLRPRGRQCRLRFERMLTARLGVAEHVMHLEARTSTWPVPVALALDSDTARRSSHRLAVLLRGQAYRGMMRETFHVGARTQPSRAAAQMLSLRSIMSKLVLPYEASGHRVDVFMTVYRMIGGPLAQLLAPFARRVVSVTSVLQRGTASQLLPLTAAVRGFLAWCSAHKQTYASVVVTRFDIYLKTDVHALLGDASTIDGFRLLWREAGGHWRHHSDPSTSDRAFSSRPWRDWRKGNPRAPDAMLAFPFAYTRCFLASVRNEFFPLRNETRSAIATSVAQCGAAAQYPCAFIASSFACSQAAWLFAQHGSSAQPSCPTSSWAAAALPIFDSRPIRFEPVPGVMYVEPSVRLATAHAVGDGLGHLSTDEGFRVRPGA